MDNMGGIGTIPPIPNDKPSINYNQFNCSSTGIDEYAQILIVNQNKPTYIPISNNTRGM